MATPASELERFRLPTRIRARQASDDLFSAEALLADRIASLPGIQTVAGGSATLPRGVDVYLQMADPAARTQSLPTLLCTIGEDGLELYGLQDRDRHRIVASGWGRLQGKSVMVHLPRDKQELEVCWDILQHAYRSFFQPSAFAPRLRPVTLGQLPRFSRTTLQ